MTTVSEAIAASVAERATEVFALMGNGNAYFTDALARQGIVRVTAVRHEAATVASADAYQRITRRTAVATTTYGPGFTNAITPLAEAACARIPLVMVVGAEPTSGRRPWDVDQAAMAAAAGARVITADALRPAAATHGAFDLAEQHHVPVVLQVPYDLASAPVAEGHAASAQAEPADDGGRRPVPAAPALQEYFPTRAEIVAAAGALNSARRPLILAGRGARGAQATLGAIADALGALTVSTAPARGTFAGREGDLGVCGGFASEYSSKLIRQADVILVVGARLNQFTTGFGDQFAEDAQIIQIDLVEAPTNPRVDALLRGDSAQVADALFAALSGHRAPDLLWGGEGEDARSSQATFRRDLGTGQAADGRLDPRTAMVRLNEILPAERQVVSDGGHFIGWSNYYLSLPAPDSLVMVGTQFQAIGLGLPSAPGAALARPGATTVVVMGDGGGLMGLPDLDTLVRVAGSAVVIVFNDACYGAEIHQYGSQGIDQSVMEIPQIDFAVLASGFGAAGIAVHTVDDLEKVQEWVTAGASGTLLLDLRISRTIVAPYILEIIEKTLKK